MRNRGGGIFKLSTSGCPSDTHIVSADRTEPGKFRCRSCEFVGERTDAIGHVVRNQFRVK